MFILSVRLSILVFSNWRWFAGKNRANKKTSSLFFGVLLVGFGGLGWVGFVGGHVYSFGTFVHSCILKLEMV